MGVDEGKNEMLEQALLYLKRASIIPVGPGKIPLIHWKEFQSRKPTEEEVVGWFKKWPKANIGIVTGKLSNIAVVDVEYGGDPSGWPKTATVKTGGGGKHFYYTYAEGVGDKVKIKPLTDIRGEGGFVVAPPSVHSSGVKYEWEIKGELSTFPIELLTVCTQAKTSDWKEKLTSPLEVGSRNTDMTSIVGGLLVRFPQSEWETIVWSLVEDKNSLQSSPLPPNELRTLFNSISSAESRKRMSSGIIKDLKSEEKDGELEIHIVLGNATVHYHVKNIVSSLMEGSLTAWVEKQAGVTDDIEFFLKLKSDSNKEQLTRILSKAFDNKEAHESYPWTVIVTKVCQVVENFIRTKKQDWEATEIVPKPAEWLYEPFIQKDQINTIFGLGSSGKTLLSLYFAKQIATDKGLNILFVDYEDSMGGWREKLGKICSGYEGDNITDSLKNFTYFGSEQIPVAEQVEKLKEIVKKRNIGLVIVDSASLATGDSTSDEKSAVRLISALKLLKTTVLLIAHQRKNDGDKTPIGSIQYENQSRNVWRVSGTADDSDIHVIHLATSHTKANNTYLRREPVGFRINYTEEKIEINGESAKAYFDEKFRVCDRIKNILQTFPEGLTYREIADQLGMNPKTVFTHLSRKRNMFENRDERWFNKEENGSDNIR